MTVADLHARRGARGASRHTRGDAAEDPAIWVNQASPAQSTIIGTDKQGGVAVYTSRGGSFSICPTGG